MSNDVSFVGNVPEHYERGLVPMVFVDYASDIARRAAAWSPARVLETAAGTGVVTRQLRDLLPELSMFRQRSQEALRQKARRGALVLGVAAGYVKTSRDRIEKNPDKRVQDALQLVFTKFAELQSARQVHIWLREEASSCRSNRARARRTAWCGDYRPTTSCTTL